MLDKIIIIMTHQIYLLKLLSQKQMKLVLLIALLFGIINFSNAQKKGSLKTISYGENEGEYGKEYNYIAIGYISNELFAENEIVTFLTNRNHKLADTIVSGRCFYDENGNSYIDGIWKEYTDKKIIRLKGAFKVSNNKNGTGITTKKKIGEELIVKTIPNTVYDLQIKYIALKLETSINNLVEQEINYSILNDYIKKSEKVKLSYYNGDIFIGNVIYRIDLPDYKLDELADYAPKSGEFKYATGEVSTGTFYYSNYYQNIYLDEGTIKFVDGSIEKDDWLKKYKLNSIEEERIYGKAKSPTEMRNMAISIKEVEDIKRNKSETALNQVKNDNLLKQQTRRKNLIAKYGESYGNLISQGHLEIGMSKAMVNEVWKKEYFNISTALRNNQIIEIWEFDKDKMQLEIIKEGTKNKGNEGGEAALTAVLMMNLYEEQFGEIPFPKTLVLINNKLTDIYN